MWVSAIDAIFMARARASLILSVGTLTEKSLYPVFTVTLDMNELPTTKRLVRSC